MTRILIFIFLMTIITGACKTTKKVNTSNTLKLNAEVVEKIIFLIYSIETSASDTSSVVKLVDTLPSTGKLKKGNLKKDLLVGDILITFYAVDDREVENIYVDNPLKMRAETVGENSVLHSKSIDLPRAEFTVRVQMQTEFNYVILKRYNGENIEPTILLKHQL